METERKQKEKKYGRRIELNKLTGIQSSDTIRLVGLDLEFFKNKEKIPLNFPAQIGLCYYDVDVNTLRINPREDVLSNVFIEQHPYELKQVDWRHAQGYIGYPDEEIGFQTSDEFERAVPKIKYFEAMEEIERVCQGVDFFMVGHSIANDILGMKFHVETTRIIDTAELYRPNFGKTPSLKELAKKFLDMEIQTGLHPPLEDAKIPLEIVLGVMKKRIPSPVMNNTTSVNTTRIIIPKNKAGALIGKNGDNIKRIRAVSGAEVNVASEEDSPPNSRLVLVSSNHSKDAIDKAVEEITSSVNTKVTIL